MTYPDHIHVTVEQRCLAAQALWCTANRMLDEDNPRAREWLHTIGYDEMRYRCRCKRTTEAFFDARTLVPKEVYPLPEDFAWMFLTVCVSKKSMNLNRDWRTYLQKEIDRISTEPTGRT